MFSLSGNVAFPLQGSPVLDVFQAILDMEDVIFHLENIEFIAATSHASSHKNNRSLFREKPLS